MTQDIAATVQAITGIAALAIALATFAQGKKIKELVDIVLQLQNQNQIMSKQLDLQSYISLLDKSAIFRPAGYVCDTKQSIKPLITISNLGKRAFEVKVANFSPEFIKPEKAYHGLVEENNGFRFFLDLTGVSYDDYKNKGCPFEFDIFFETIDHVPVKQHVYRDNSAVGYSVTQIEVNR